MTDPNQKLPLAKAAEIAFPDGSVTARALRRERDAGRLKCYKIAGRDFTTLADIEEMAEACASKPVNAPQGAVVRERARKEQPPPPAEAALRSAFAVADALLKGGSKRK